MIVEQPEYILNKGTRVKTHAELETITGMMISYKYLVLRRTNDGGIIRGPVPGHGGDVYWVEHYDGVVAVYCFTEFELDD